MNCMIGLRYDTAGVSRNLPVGDYRETQIAGYYGCIPGPVPILPVCR